MQPVEGRHHVHVALTGTDALVGEGRFVGVAQAKQVGDVFQFLGLPGLEAVHGVVAGRFAVGGGFG
ncbi:MAG: hypothetical protein NTX04_09070, partial [Verrucomicrobia bacterium]|nr:hypothetical protein [Verrucomicrobiota bacterium]